MFTYTELERQQIHSEYVSELLSSFDEKINGVFHLYSAEDERFETVFQNILFQICGSWAKVSSIAMNTNCKNIDTSEGTGKLE